MIESLFFALLKFFGVLILFFFIIGVTFWIIDFCDNRERKRRDTIDRRRWAGARIQPIKKNKKP
jgi:predicted lipid-binding transport protein (Tim44 family)